MSTFRRLLQFLAPYKKGVWLSGILAAIAMGATVAIPALTGAAVNAIDDGDKDALKLFGLLIGVAGIVRLGLTIARRLIAGRVSLGVELDLRNRLYEHLLALELGFFDRQQTGQLMSRATVDLQAVRFFLGYGLVFISQAALTILFAGIAMFIIDPVLALVALSPVPFVVWIAIRYGRQARPALQEVQQRIGELTADVEENVGGVRVVKAFAREDRSARAFAQRGPRLRPVDDLDAAAGVLQPVHRVPAADRARAAAVPRRSRRHRRAPDHRRVHRVLHVPARAARADAVPRHAARHLPARDGLGRAALRAARSRAAHRGPADAVDLPAGSGRVELRGATLTYEGAKRAGARRRHAHAGRGHDDRARRRDGLGKTTLVQLVSRLYDVTAGAVLVDGADVRDVDPRSLRREIAVVNDDPFLFSATVHENIAYARADATREEVVAAAQRAQAHEFIEALPDGYDTRVGERGLTLSGGQRQRIAIARALLADPRILILDDATSSVDASTEQQIKRALAEVMAGRTTFVIAHRLSTIALADEIAVLEGGRLLDHGTHDELLERSPFYAEIVEKGLPDQVFLTRKPREPEVAGL